MDDRTAFKLPMRLAEPYEHVAFESAYRILRRRIEALLALPLDELQLDRTHLKAALDRVGALP